MWALRVFSTILSCRPRSDPRFQPPRGSTLRGSETGLQVRMEATPLMSRLPTRTARWEKLSTFNGSTSTSRYLTRLREVLPTARFPEIPSGANLAAPAKPPTTVMSSPNTTSSRTAGSWHSSLTRRPRPISCASQSRRPTTPQGLTTGIRSRIPGFSMTILIVLG